MNWRAIIEEGKRDVPTKLTMILAGIGVCAILLWLDRALFS